MPDDPELSRLRAHNERLTRYLRALQRTHADLSVDRTLESVLDAAEELFGCSAAMIVMFEPGTAQRRVKAARNLPDSFLRAVEASPSPLPAMLEEQTAVAIAVGDHPCATRLAPAVEAESRRAGIGGSFVLRLQHDGEMIGTLALHYPEYHDICCDERAVAEIFAAQAASAIAHARAYQESDRLRCEQERSRERLHQIVDCLTDHLLVWGRDLNLAMANDSARAFLREVGWQQDDRPVRLESDPETCPVHAVFRGAGGTVSRSIELRGHAYEVRCHPLRDPVTGELAAVVEQIRDVTETRALELQLSHSEERLREAMSNAPAGIVIVDAATGRVQQANEMIAELTGLPAESLPDRDWLEIFDPEDHKRLRAAQAQILHEQKRTELEIRVRGTGEPVPVVAMVGRIDYSDGSRSMQVMLRDLRRRLRLQTQLMEQEKLAAIGQLASGVAHEIRNPLSIIAGAIYDLEDLIEVEDSEVAEDLRIARDEIRRVQEIISNVLDFARGSSVEREQVDLADIMRRAVALTRKSMASRNVSVELETDGDTTIWANAGALRQVALNLLTNSYQATADGGRIAVRVWSPHDQAACFSVADTGVGIPPEVLGNIFNPFFTTKSPGQGTGLGLSIVHTTIREHGGSIEVDSEPGRGTIFTVRLPRQAVAPATERDDDPLLAAADELAFTRKGAW